MCTYKGLCINQVREGSQKCKNVVFDHNWGGGVCLKHTLIA